MNNTQRMKTSLNSRVSTATGFEVSELHTRRNSHNIHIEEQKELSLLKEDFLPLSNSSLIASSNHYNYTHYDSFSPTPEHAQFISKNSTSLVSSSSNYSPHSSFVVKYKEENAEKEGNNIENDQARNSRVFRYLKYFDIFPQLSSLKSYLYSYTNSTDTDELEILFDSTNNDLSFHELQLNDISASRLTSVETSLENDHQPSITGHLRLEMERKTIVESIERNNQSTNSTPRKSLSFESQSSSSQSFSSNSSNNSLNRFKPSVSEIMSSTSASLPTSTPSSNKFSFSSLFTYHSLADKLHKYPYLIVSHGRASAIGLVLSYLFFLALCFPVWLLSFIITELGVYCGITIMGFKIGRAILRLIAFPGASQRVSSEIGSEFAKCTIRTLESALEACVESGNLILSSKKTNVTTHSNSGSNLEGLNDNNVGTVTISNEFSSSWALVCSYRNRIFGTLSDVLFTLLCEDGAGVDMALSSNDNHRESGVFTSNLDNLTSYGNNKLVGDIGDLSGLLTTARNDGVTLSKLLVRILNDLKSVDEFCCNICSSSTGPVIVNEDIILAARQMLMTAREFRDFLSVLKRNQNSSSDKDDETNQTNNAENNKSSMQMLKSAVKSIIPMLDPPPYPSIFCLDVSRGCLLSRYKGAKQIWIQRPRATGMIDAIYIPSSFQTSPQKKAVLYCNPNAGFYEVAAGVNFFGGTIENEKDINVQGSNSVADESCWTDFYLQNGYDIMLFNYTGYGRSYGVGMFGGRISPSSNTNGGIHRLARILRSFFFEFTPSPSSLKEDALTIARHLTDELNVESLIIHGESIGGMAAASAARHLTQEHERKLRRNGGEFNLVANTPCKVSALICDRTFSNLIAVAQRLVGEWTGTAIRILAPFWQTDVTYDFLTANCPKIVCNDAADAIIADASSLISGISQAKELRKGNTKGAGLLMNAPLEYQMADFEGLGVLEYTNIRLNAPVWPVDKHITEQEAFHFAACVTRIAKLATAEKKSGQKYDLPDMNNENMNDDEGVEMTVSSLSRKTIGKYLDDSSDDSDDEDVRSPLFKSPHKKIQNSLVDVWNLLACCYGLCGAPLGQAVKGGPDCVLAWLCAAVTYGSQHIAEIAERRLGQQAPKNKFGDSSLSIKSTDFDYILENFYEDEDNEIQIKPISLPFVVEELKKKCTEDGGKIDGLLDKIGDELRFCIDILEYIIARTSSTFHVSSAIDNMHFRTTNENVSVGSFLKLHCGHNNMFAKHERDKLRSNLTEIIGEDV